MMQGAKGSALNDRTTIRQIDEDEMKSKRKGICGSALSSRAFHSFVSLLKLHS